MADEVEPSLDIPRHLKYWKMCLRSPLPSLYQSNEGNRMALAYFIINSITILTPFQPVPRADGTIPTPLIAPGERRQLREWVLSHRHPSGGFSGTSSLVFPLHGYEEWDFETGTSSREHLGLANITATLFALQLLVLLSDDETPEAAFRGVDRVQTLRWLSRLQREDGSFGEVLKMLPDHGWFIGGGYDMRYCYIAASIRWILRGDVNEGEPGWVEDFDTGALAQYIISSQTYDGGFAGSSKEEPHAGYAYCAIGALSLLDRPLEDSSASHPSKILNSGIRNMPGLIHWLASRQFNYLEPGQHDDDYDSDEDEVNFVLPRSLADLSLEKNQRYIGYNGRCNKVADTCYSWWVGAALANLGREGLVEHAPARRFLLEKMQHRIGGFGKKPGNPPDLYHACFGLCILAVMGEEGLNQLDSALALPVEMVRRIEKARTALLSREGENGTAGRLAKDIVGIGLGLRDEKPGWLTAAGG
ncbi:terpenoid cyclases/protein prenyltransferase alpha-alpha toroid [Lasiosphaeria hispida]|uniref:Terpenoid cyclases/protein prenyltransferase alpha-alpha toroid n=1 Tax=Lasiosphaeria hispida TaxID=260671 RepID=A0AAJ0HAN9_9PEZI|nr:terpenoid cyclases/protein prenyltransferase alpha-alpha toroid [Lasiosphaeria hispida]